MTEAGTAFRRLIGAALLGNAIRRNPALATAVAMVVLGAAANLAFAPFFLLPVLPLALGVLYLRIQELRPRAAAAAGFWFGLGHFAFGLSWIAEAYRMRADIPDWLGPPSVLALAAYLALYPAAAAAVFSAAPRRLRRGFWGLCLFAALWSLTEFLRGKLLTGFPWNPMAESLAFSALTLQPLAFIGPHAAGLLVVAWSLFPAQAVAQAVRRGRMDRRDGVLWALFFLLALAWVAAGLLRLPPAGSQQPSAPKVTLRLVQPDTDQRTKWDPQRRSAHLARLVELSRSLGPAQDGQLVIIWPEAAVPDYRLADQPGRRALIMRLLPPDALLITGVPRLEPVGEQGYRLYNSILVLGPHGAVLARYDKRRLVPFGEYLPARAWLSRLGLGTLVDSAVDFTPGRGPAVVDIPALPRFAPGICYEAVFPGAARRARRDGAAFLLNLTNDAWFGTGAGPYQHFAQARMRAVETGLPLVRVAQTGISAVVDGYGRITTRIDLGQKSVRDTSLPRPLVPTFYVKRGESVYAALLILLFLVAIMAGVRYSRRE